MSETIRVPDIGSGDGEVIELLVKVGDTVEAEQSLVVLESDKASMEIPAPRPARSPPCTSRSATPSRPVIC